jgi:hypothetical protein
LDVTFPVYLDFASWVWHFQLLFLTIVVCIIVAVGFLAECKITSEVLGYIQNLKTQFSGVQFEYGVRDELRRLDICPICWTKSRVVVTLFGAFILAVSPFLFTSSADRVLSLVAFLFGYITLGACNLATYGSIKRGKRSEAISYLWSILALVWLMLWYDFYVKSWVAFGMELRDIWFMAAYGSGVVTWMMYFAYHELKDNARNIYKVLVGEGPRDKFTLGLRSAIALCIYAAAARVLVIPLPLLPSTAEPYDASAMQALNGIIGVSQTLFMDVFTIFPSVVFVVVFARLLWRRHLRVSIPVKRVLKALYNEALSFAYDEGRMVLIFLAGLVLLSARAHGISASVLNVPRSTYLAVGFVELIVFTAITVRCYSIGKMFNRWSPN